MLPSLRRSPFAVETLVLRGLWGEMRERRTLPWKEQQRKAKYLAGSLPQSGIMGQRRSSLWELRLWVLTGLGPVWLHPQTLLFIDSIIRARKCKHIQVLTCQLYPKRRYLDAYEYHRSSFFFILKSTLYAIILGSVWLPPRISSRLLHNYNHYRRRHFLLQPLDKRKTVSLNFLWMAAETFVSCPSS